MAENSTNNNSTDDIRREMNDVRYRLAEDVDGLVDSAKTLADWRYYLRHYPWWCLAGAAAVGFVLVPKRVEIVSPSADAIEELARRNKLVVEKKPKAQSRGGTGSTLTRLLVSAALRGAVGYVGQHAGKWLGEDHARGNGST